jgi:poly-gamma-glutamate biosynthesis protein PgsC/CapC
MIMEALFVGLVVGFLFYEVIGYSPGGVVAPGYLALFVADPQRIVVTLLLACGVWGLLHVLSARLILYGRRRLLLALLLGFSATIAVERWIQPLGGLGVDIQSIGYIIPGLIGNEMVRQKVFPTLASLGIVTVLVALILMLW